MPEFALSPGVAMFYRIDDLADPWKISEPVLMLHGNYESGLAWNGWLPRFARRFRVVRPDMRGFGRSTPMPLEHKWSLDEIMNDYLGLADNLGIERFHLIGAKFGASMSLYLTAKHPDRVRTLTVIGPRIRGQDSPSAREDTIEQIQREGLESWARDTMVERLGSECDPDMLVGWGKVMGTSPISTQISFARGLPGIDISDELPKIARPTLAITTDRTVKGSVEWTRSWLEKIPDSELIALPGNSFHVALTHADQAAQAAIAFIDRVGART